MIDMASLGIIKIVKIPQGEMSLEIRKAWLGIEMPCLFIKLCDKPIGLLSRERLSQCQNSYVVLQEHAIAALEQKRPRIGKVWRESGFPRSPTAAFSFRQDEAVEIKPVTDQSPKIAVPYPWP